MCGASQEQKDLNASQTNFYNQLTSQYATEYANNQEILNTLKTSLSPIVTAGPSQEGFSPEQKAALNAQATEGAAKAYRDTQTATREAQAARGGGNSPFTSAADEQLNSQIALGAETNLNNNKLDIINKDYDTGRENYGAAVGALSGVPSAIQSANSSAAGVATGAGGAAAEEANAINSANSSWMGLVGGLASSAVGGLTSAGGLLGGKKK